MELVIGIFLGIFFHRMYVHIKVHMWEKRIEQKTHEVLTKFRENIIPSKIEHSNGMYYLYNRETNEFLGQGTSMKELESSVKTRFPEKLFDVPQEELTRVMKEKYDGK